MAKSDVIASEIRNRSKAELESLLAEKTEELHKTKFGYALGQITKTHLKRDLKRDIARINTVLGEKQQVVAED